MRIAFRLPLILKNGVLILIRGINEKETNGPCYGFINKFWSKCWRDARQLGLHFGE
jgi:hypothetical protein